MNADNELLSVEKLIEMLHDTDSLVQVQAGFMLGTMGTDALPAVPTLIEMLEYGDIPTQKVAALTLGRIGPAAEEAIPALFDAANDDENDDVSDLAMWASEEIDLAQVDEEPEAEAA